MKETQAEVIMLRWHKRPLPNMRKKINGVQVWKRITPDTSTVSSQPYPMNRSADKSELHPLLEESGPNNAVNDKNNTTPDKSQLVYYSALVRYNSIAILTVVWKNKKRKN